MPELLMLPPPEKARPSISTVNAEPFREFYGPYWGEKLHLQYAHQYRDRPAILVGDVVVSVPGCDRPIYARAAVRLDDATPAPSIADVVQWARGRAVEFWRSATAAEEPLSLRVAVAFVVVGGAVLVAIDSVARAIAR